MFLCAYNRKDAVAAQDSNSWSVFSGVSVGGGGSNLVWIEGFEAVDRDRCLESCPEDILRRTV